MVETAAASALTPKSPIPKSPIVPTRVVLPPAPNGSSTVATDPNLLLDAFDTYVAASRRNKSSESSKEHADPIAFLNQHYQNEGVLVAMLPEIRQAIAERRAELDDRISSALQRQSETAAATQRHVQDAQASVISLEQRIRQVQEKAQQSEAAVIEITKDLKRLDCAKKNLQKTITTLKRLHMLIHAVEQLRLACLQQPFPDYRNAANLVDATRLLLAHFEGFSSKVEPIRLLSQKVSDLQIQLRLTLLYEFRVVGFGKEKALELEEGDKAKKSKGNVASSQAHVRVILKSDDDEGNSTSRKLNPDAMAGGALMIDALGVDVRKDFIQTLCQDHLEEYNRSFMPFKPQKEQKRVSSFKAQPEPSAPEKPDSCLELIEKRFVWFRTLLEQTDAKYPKVFPKYWNMQYYLTVVFLKVTRNHILGLLKNGPSKDPEAGNATILLKALQKTIVFEKEVSTVLDRQYGTKFMAPGEEGVKTEKGKDSLVQNIKEQQSVKPLYGLASSAFDNYMRPYIALEEQSMDEQLVEALEDRTVDTRGDLPVFTTSTKLFVYIKGSITRCTALTKGNAFFLLHRAFQDALKKYAQVLSSKLPPPIQQSATVGGINLANVKFGGKQDRDSSQTASYRVPNGEEVTVCHVIATCEYCAETVEALEDLIKDTIDEQYKEKIELMNQQELFHDTTAKAIRVLVSGMENRLEDALKMMSSINWGQFDEVGEESAYVRIIHKEVQPYVTASRDLIPTSYFRSFCDKFALNFTNNYYESMIRLKRISEPASQQLLLDVYNLKTLFLKLPVMEKVVQSSTSSPSRTKTVPAGSSIAPAMYTKMVQKQFKRIETLLKMVGTPANMLVDVFRDQWQGGTALDLQTVMALKGMKRIEQVGMLEKFGLDPATALRGATVNVTSATIVSERLQAVQDQAAKFGKSFR